MAIKQEQTLIRNLYPRLRDLAEGQYNNPVSVLYTTELEQEHNHRGLVPTRKFFIKYFTPGDAAKYFTLRFVFLGEKFNHYTVNDILNVRLGCLYGQAIANKYRDAIKQEFKPEEVEKLLELDYAKMMENS